MGQRSEKLKAVFTRPSLNISLAKSFQKLRRQIFIDELNWDLRAIDGCEIDQFDTDDAAYCLLFCGGSLVGGFRAIPSTQPYLARSVFPQMATLRPFPQ